MGDRWVWVVLVLPGLLLIARAVREAVEQRRLRRNGAGAGGVVVRHRTRNGGSGGRAVHAVLSFRDAQGRSHEFEAHVSVPGGLPVGGRVPVLSLPGAPTATARVDLDSTLRTAVGLRLGGGVFFLVLALVPLLRG